MLPIRRSLKDTAKVTRPGIPRVAHVG